jgi:HK97 family phage major capsid protein
VVLNPLDWAKIRSLKDGENRYLIGSPLADVQPRLWDIAVVASNSMEEDTFLLGDFKRAAILFERQSMTIEVSTEHDDFFVRNLIAVRSEKRVAMAVQQPAALLVGDFGNIT